MEAIKKQTKGNAIICQFSEYPQQKAKWIKDNPGAVIIEEIKNLHLQQVQVPATLLQLGQQPNQTILMIIWAFIYEI